ncbi:FecR domain-containing protein [Flavobacterium sp. MC2016-06]|uniref:FecR family protein n=1 Tax=Flavobacterium sp. MC2016-06 TaxID=2676308 RepID=UPI0012BAD33E|nr:FecR family protein [Flavobacterium sp. MC2016-06]MBU3862180.1 FecR domain-containing protein [Flavobacterium sp. MC2016-06]
MSLGKKEFIVADLIRKELLIGELSIEENAFLQEWLSAPENQEYYQKVIDFETLKSKEAFYSAINTDIAFERVREKINKNNTPVVPLFRYKHLLKYAAVFLVLLGITATFLFTIDEEGQKEVVVNSISPKYNNPTLILADGTVVSLEPKREKIVSKNGVISNVNQVLVYDTKALQGTTSTGDNTLIVPVGGIYAVNLSDGTKVWLNSKSSLRYPVEFSGDTRTVTLEGEAYFEVTKNPHSPFTVKTKSGNVTVLGTHFNVSSYIEDQVFAATLAEGKVKVSNNANVSDKTDVFLVPGQQARINNKTDGIIRVAEVDPAAYTAWKDGKFYFENEDLKSILTKMARWYNFNVKFESKSLEQVKFTGIVLKEEPIDHLLDIISKTSNINYKITKVNHVYEVTVSK